MRDGERRCAEVIEPRVWERMTILGAAARAGAERPSRIGVRAVGLHIHILNPFAHCFHSKIETLESKMPPKSNAATAGPSAAKAKPAGRKAGKAVEGASAEGSGAAAGAKGKKKPAKKRKDEEEDQEEEVEVS